MTMGDVAGIGPEVVASACQDSIIRDSCVPIVVGDPQILERALRLIHSSLRVEPVNSATAQTKDGSILCWNPVEQNAVADLPAVAPGALDARAGRAAYQWLVAAAEAALASSIDAIVTAPLNKEALNQAGFHYPGHTEILAACCGVARYAMMLYVPPGGAAKSPHGLGIAHVTLHTSIASVPSLITREGVAEKISLVDGFLRRIGVAVPRIGICALNPHGGEEGLFGNEEQSFIRPAVEQSANIGIRASGPIPADTLIRRALAGEFDGVVAMYHDQGHIPIKLVARDLAVNVTLGLPIVRTSPSHGTAFDIAWQGRASAEGMIEAIRVAAALVTSQRTA